jgi:hypothetical protein
MDHVEDDSGEHIWLLAATNKMSLQEKVATYQALKHRGHANINHLLPMELYEMMLVDRVFVAALDMNDITSYRYRLFIMWIDDDVAALTRWYQNGDVSKDSIICLLMKFDAPRCMRFLLQNEAFREWVMRTRMSPLVQQLAEELVQPTDQLCKEWLLIYGQSVKLIGMCVKDEELVVAWFSMFTKSLRIARSFPSVMLARKLHALATPDQREAIRIEVSHTIPCTELDEGCFEMAWLFGLLGPFNPPLQNHFLKYHVSLFPAFTFAMIVALCDEYLELLQPKITAPQRRFFALVMRLPMDLQALVALRMWGSASTVIQIEKFDKAFLTII